ncbi:hypothetical protein [Niveibacterium sp.]|uniref:hypothetical protein n=1 Tax=Niveibacterium sp. TaxID=2017444 RepID=UPI0035AF1BED
MPKKQGSLIGQWRALDAAGVRTAVIVIDEPEGFGFAKAKEDPSPLSLPLLSNQGAILQLVDQFQSAIACFVELNPGGGTKWTPTDRRLRRLVSQTKSHTVPKQHFSAFDDTTLYNLLWEQHGVSHLVVMGHFGGQCVKQSIFGGARRPSGHESTIIRPGAIDYDFEVYTTQRLINGSISDWPEHHKVSIFDHI